MTKQLRLASALLTDVGRKRERNQDNITRQIPTEPDLFDEKGALFVVCDGMGGHAAGEVASEIGVNTIRDTYFATRGQDVITAIAKAVKTANDAIYTLARDHSEYSGMGTTCVSLVTAGGRAYIVNIGDSRAYLIRDGHMRQVTQDHSWVAEQVRIGLLTEEQARMHAHRNVITRSLGTQPSITADLFVETLHEGDRVLMCSDGLHGYVEEAAIEQELLTQADPEVATRNLVDMANANGGPDNISVVVVDILEAPEVSGPIPLPANTVDPIAEGTTQPLPVPSNVSTPVAPAAAAAAVAGATERAPSPASSTSTKLAKPAKPPKRARGDAADAAGTAGVQRRRGQVIALRLLEFAALVVILAGVWYVGFGPLATQRQMNQQALSQISVAQRIIKQSANQDPVTALKSLAQARTLALSEVNNAALDPATRAQAQALLDQQLAPAVQMAIQRYNTAARIQRLAVTNAVSYTVNCPAAGGAAPAPITAISGLATAAAPAGKPAIVAGRQIAYIISGGALYEVLLPVDAQGAPTSGTDTCTPITLPGVSAALAITSDGQTIYALTQQTAGGYSVQTVAPLGANPDGSAKVKVASLFNVPVTQETPTHLAALGKSVFVSFAGGATTPYGVWLFNGTGKGPAQTITLPQAAASLVTANNTLYLLLVDGTLGQLDVSHLYTSLVTLAPTPATTTDPSAYTAAMPVPTPQNTAGATAAAPVATATAIPATAPTATVATTATTATPAGTAAAPAGATATPAPTMAPAAPVSPTPTIGTLFTGGATLALDPLAPSQLLLNDPANSRIVRLATSASGPGLGFVEQYVYGAPISNVSQLAVVGSAAAPNALMWSGAQLVAEPLPAQPA